MELGSVTLKINNQHTLEIYSVTFASKNGKVRKKALRTPRHPITMASTEPPDPIPCALSAILLPESRAHGCHMKKGLFQGTYWVHVGTCVFGQFLVRGALVRSGCAAGAYNNQPFIVLTETKFSYRYIPVWARYSPHRTRVEAHANMLSP